MITNIQRYAINDGGGIRTAVFFKGCPLACAWCHNPETQSFADEGDVLKVSPDKLAQIVLRDQIFFGSSGGVTLSGGEVLAQDTAYIVQFLKILKQNDIHIACDTCGDAPWESFESVLPYVDVFLYDIKVADSALHKRWTGQGNERIIANLEKLNGIANVWLRIPVIGGFNDGAEMAAIIALAKGVAPNRRVSLLPYHAMGEGKRSKISKAPSQHDFYTPRPDQMQKIAVDWEHAGFDVEI